LAGGWVEPVNAYYKSWVFPINKSTQSTISLRAALCQLFSLDYQSFYLRKLKKLVLKPESCVFIFSVPSAQKQLSAYAPLFPITDN